MVELQWSVYDFAGSAGCFGLPGLPEARSPECGRKEPEMRRLPPCLPHSRRYSGHAAGRRDDRTGLSQPFKVQFYSHRETTFSVNLTTHVVVVFPLPTDDFPATFCKLLGFSSLRF